MYNRPAISEIFILSYLRVKKHFEGRLIINLLAAVSDEESEKLCLKYNIPHIAHYNRPLGRKHNKMVLSAITFFQNYDYICLFGDDDIMSNELFELYLPFIESQIDYFGIKRSYVVDTATMNAGYFEYSQDNKLTGCGRMFSNRAIEETFMVVPVVTNRQIKVNNMVVGVGENLFLPEKKAKYLAQLNFVTITGNSVFKMWDDDLEKGLDNNSELKLLFNGFTPVGISTDRPLITDIKSSQNVWSFQSLKNHKMFFPSSVYEATSFFSMEEKKLLVNIFAKEIDIKPVNHEPKEIESLNLDSGEIEKINTNK